MAWYRWIWVWDGSLSKLNRSSVRNVLDGKTLVSAVLDGSSDPLKLWLLSPVFRTAHRTACHLSRGQLKCGPRGSVFVVSINPTCGYGVEPACGRRIQSEESTGEATPLRRWGSIAEGKMGRQFEFEGMKMVLGRR